MGVGTRVWMGSAVRVALERDRGNLDVRRPGKPLLELVVLGLALREDEPPSVVVDRYVDVIRVVEGRCGAVERLVVEVPLR